MAVVIASALDKDMAGNPLFRGVSFKLERGDRMTLAGRNGAGKMTLLRMLSGETGIDGGELVFEKGTRVALHDQRPPRERDLTLRDYVLSGCRDLVALEEDLRRLEGEMAERPDDRALLERYSRAQSRLEAVGTSVLELEAGRSRFFPGPWHAWRREAAAREIQLGKQIEKQQAEIARMERFIERFRYKATKARQAQSRVKKLGKMERIERDPTDNRSLGFKFSGAEAEKPLEGLSGGERRRLSLAILVASGSNLLILDEPTNHLDIDAREALEDALRAFDGTVLLVSHDRALLDAVGTRTIGLEDGRLRSYAGGWAEYSRVREERREAEATAKRTGRAERAAAKPKVNGRPKKPAGPSKNAVKRAAGLEREVERAEAALRALEDELADPSAWASPTSSERATKRHAAAKKAVEEAYARWEAASN